MDVAVVIGNPNPPSRTSALAGMLADSIAELVGGTRTLTLELATVASRLFELPNSELDDLTATIARSDIVVFASPTYKATYSGMLKAFLDRYTSNADLSSVIAVPLMTGAAPNHSMAPDVHLRPLLVELGASVPTSSLYMVMAQFDEADQAVDSWIRRNGRVLALIAGQTS